MIGGAGMSIKYEMTAHQQPMLNQDLDMLHRKDNTLLAVFNHR